MAKLFEDKRIIFASSVYSEGGKLHVIKKTSGKPIFDKDRPVYSMIRGMSRTLITSGIFKLIFREQPQERKRHLQNSLCSWRQRNRKDVWHFERKTKTKRFCYDWHEEGRNHSFHQHRPLQLDGNWSFEKAWRKGHHPQRSLDWSLWSKVYSDPDWMRPQDHERILVKMQENQRYGQDWPALFRLLWRKHEERMHWRWIPIRWELLQEGLGKWEDWRQGWHGKHRKTCLQSLRMEKGLIIKLNDLLKIINSKYVLQIQSDSKCNWLKLTN